VQDLLQLNDRRAAYALLGAAAAGPSTVFAVGGFTNPAQRTLVLQNAQA